MVSLLLARVRSTVCDVHSQVLSSQQLVDCTTAVGNEGCDGGDVDPTYNWVQANGLCTDASYPYTAVDGTCKTSCTPVAHITGYVSVAVNNDTALATAVAQQPVQVRFYSCCHAKDQDSDRPSLVRFGIPCHPNLKCCLLLIFRTGVLIWALDAGGY